MSQTKYMMSSGLAFSEEKDLKKLRQHSLKGWHVQGFRPGGYSLQKGESTDYIYAYDYRLLATNEQDEYLELFTSSGWTPIASEAGIHLFQALPGTKPIHSDQESTVEKHESISRFMRALAYPVILLTIALWLGWLFAEGALQTGLFYGALALTPLALPLAWTVLTLAGNTAKAKGKSLYQFTTLMLPFALFLALIVLLTDNMASAIRMGASMLVCGAAFALIFSFSLSLFDKYKQKNG
ncbi:hypothetical protein JOC54_000410 [Alkalihalobacillus xiaoxiensis]|uniref:DUF2812 domain-containing protein n=1 Tax=Shouchella xiaoxiensis TaxID=766895 RepID=A0ABS2SNS6_9BACI|nr:DUF2812 domain-containing protein [Shouchella xiaoxiensis]MBM7837179.1 hypothetical protein [Shouchella xiaoxiensis]